MFSSGLFQIVIKIVIFGKRFNIYHRIQADDNMWGENAGKLHFTFSHNVF